MAHKKRRNRALAFGGVAATLIVTSHYWLDHVYLVLLGIESFGLVSGATPDQRVMIALGYVTLLALAIGLFAWISRRRS